jgi:hypothetical protein
MDNLISYSTKKQTKQPKAKKKERFDNLEQLALKCKFKRHFTGLKPAIDATNQDKSSYNS